MGKPEFNIVRDVISGVILAATSVPQLIAYAETAGYAGYRGLATAGLPLAAWGITTGSPYMNAGVTAVTSLMAKSDVRGDAFMQNHTEEEYVVLMAVYSLWVGLASLLLALLKFGTLAQKVPQPVRAGFKWGCSLGVLVAALPNGLFHAGNKELQTAFQKELLSYSDLIKMLPTGAKGLLQSFFALTHPWLWGIEAAFMFLGGTYFIMYGKDYVLPKSLPPGTDVILVTAIATLYSTASHFSGSIVGEIPTLDSDAGISLLGGWIRIPVQFLSFKQLVNDVSLVEQFGGSYLMLFLTSVMYAGVNFLSLMGIAGTFETENGIPWNAERELTAQGVSCLAAAAVGSAPVSGSLSRSLVSRMTGTTSQVACLVTAACWIYLQPYMSVMTPTPKAALSAVVVSAVLTGIAKPKDLLQLKGGLDRSIGWMTGLVTCLTSPTTGFAIGLVLYLTLAFIVSDQKDRPKKKKE